jgi:proton-dependent oligopeptide transporter, POT family
MLKNESNASKYKTAPDPNQTDWPKGVPYIIGNEGCERFSFYGMKSILQVHITALFVATSVAHNAAEENAQAMVHLFVAGVYAFPMIGAIIADRLLGKYHTILSLSLVYCLGHLVLSLAESSIGGMWMGLALIAIGSGGVKPCVSAHVGDQFGRGNWHLLTKIFQAFYFIINFGSFFATLLIPAIRSWEQSTIFYGDLPGFHFNVMGHELTTSLAFGLPGILMFLATIVFWMGRKVFIHVPPNPGGKLGLLDTISSSLLFMGLIGLPMFFMESIVAAVKKFVLAASWGSDASPWLLEGLSQTAFWLVAVGTVVAGLMVFLARQKIDADDGFLAVMIHSVGAMFSGMNSKARLEAADVGPGDTISSHWFFASAARKFSPLTAEGPRAVLRIVSVFLMVSIFWALFDQHASSWIRQATRMNLDVRIPLWGTLTLLPSQISALNPLMVMFLIPFNNYLLYPLIDKNILRLTPLRKMTIGMVIASTAFVFVALLQTEINSKESALVAQLIDLRDEIAAGESATASDLFSDEQLHQMVRGQLTTATELEEYGGFSEACIASYGAQFLPLIEEASRVSVLWQFFPFLIMTLAEVMISITGLEFAYSQAPNRMKSTIMGFWLLTVALGNTLVVIITKLPDMELLKFFWFFAGMMALAAVIFGLRASFYQYKDYSQSESG